MVTGESYKMAADNYIRKGLGINEQELKQLREQLLEPAI
jgi:hypothetical protein